MSDDELNTLHDLALRFWNEHNTASRGDLDGDAWCFISALKGDMVARGLLTEFWDRTPQLVH